MLNDILAVLPYAGFAVACGSILMGLAIWAANAAEDHDDWMF